MKTMAIVLAAGLGKRMKSKLHKVLHPVCGKAMVSHVIDATKSANVERTVVIVGHGSEEVKAALGNEVEYAVQEQQLGTGHAVMQAESLLKDEEGVTFVLCGDTPLITARSLTDMVNMHLQSGAAATVASAILEQPQGYGRIIRNESGRVEKIVEQKDCNEKEEKVQEINAGIYCFDNQKLFQALKQVGNNNAQGEYYLTDVIGILKNKNESIQAYVLESESEAMGVNDRVALAEAERVMRERINHNHMLNGVTLIDPLHTYIDSDVVIGQDTVIYPGTCLKGRTVLGEGCHIGPNADITNTKVGDSVHIKHSVLTDACVGSEAVIGPYAYLRPQARIGQRVKIGDFVEIKNSSIGDDSKVSHLGYVGDAEVGKKVNIGCGAITVNYDGYAKHKTQIEDGAFIGSNVNLIAPVKVSKNAYIVAGSTITDHVPEDSVAIARQRQTTKPGYAKVLKQRIQARSKNNKEV